MKPHNAHAPALPNKLPDQRPQYDRDGRLLHDGKTLSFGKVLASLKKHHQETLNDRTKK